MLSESALTEPETDNMQDRNTAGEVSNPAAQTNNPESRSSYQAARLALQLADRNRRRNATCFLLVCAFVIGVLVLFIALYNLHENYLHNLRLDLAANNSHLG